MDSIFMDNENRKTYALPVVEITYFHAEKDVLCMSSEGNDNDFDAGGMGEF